MVYGVFDDFDYFFLSFFISIFLGGGSGCALTALAHYDLYVFLLLDVLLLKLRIRIICSLKATTLRFWKRSTSTILWQCQITI